MIPLGSLRVGIILWWMFYRLSVYGWLAFIELLAAEELHCNWSHDWWPQACKTWSSRPVVSYRRASGGRRYTENNDWFYPQGADTKYLSVQCNLQCSASFPNYMQTLCTQYLNIYIFINIEWSNASLNYLHNIVRITYLLW